MTAPAPSPVSPEHPRAASAVDKPGPSRKAIIPWGVLGPILVPLVLFCGYVVLFRLSARDEDFVCRWCGVHAEAKAVCVFGRPVWRGALGAPTPSYQTRIYRLAALPPCRHTWEWNFANSSGLLFTSGEDWDGPLGNYGISEQDAEREELLLQVLRGLPDDDARKQLLDRLRRGCGPRPGELEDELARARSGE